MTTEEAQNLKNYRESIGIKDDLNDVLSLGSDIEDQEKENKDPGSGVKGEDDDPYADDDEPITKTIPLRVNPENQGVFDNQSAISRRIFEELERDSYQEFVVQFENGWGKSKKFDQKIQKN